MHCNYHFFKRLENPLKDNLKGKKLLECFSQEKDELILGFGNETGDFFIRCSVASTFSGLYFTEIFHRARQNSVDLFEEYIDNEVLDVFVFNIERAIAIVFNEEKRLVLKLYGNRSNVLGFKKEKVQSIFNSKLPDDEKMLFSELHRPILQNEDNFLQNEGNPLKVFPTWGKIPKSFYETHAGSDLRSNWTLCNKINAELAEGKFHIIRFKGKLHLSLLNTGEVLKTFDEPMKACNAFFVESNKTSQLDSEKNGALRKLSKQVKQAENYLQKTNQRLESILNGPGNQNIGHLLMANLHAIPPKAEKVVLNSFETGEPIEIRLKTKLSAQKNAEAYYRKAKKEKIELDILEANILRKETELEKLKAQIEEIESSDSLRELRGYFKKEEIQTKVPKRPKPEDLFKSFEADGFQILIGKNAKNNDLLTLKYAQKNDTWLHAKDVSGSHVIIKEKSGQKIPKTVLEKAAALAAWFSKRRTDGLVPVAFTPKKFVRKIKGSPDGQVMVDKEETILVEPLDPEKF